MNKPKKMVVKTVESKLAHRIKKVAAYARVSTLQDAQEDSYESQVAYYSAMIQANPKWEYAGVYADKGISGTQAKKRPEFMRMVRDAKNGMIDLIYVKSISRFARNTMDATKYVHELKAIGVEVVFERGHFFFRPFSGHGLKPSGCNGPRGEPLHFGEYQMGFCKKGRAGDTAFRE